MKRFWIAMIVLAVLVGGGLGMMWYASHWLGAPVEVSGGVLLWEVAGAYPEERDDSLWGRVRGGDPTLAETLFALERGAGDDRITALVMDFRGLAADWAKVEELRTAVARFRAADKPVHAYLDGAGTRDYALAAAADTVVMSPEANLMVMGVSARLEFLRDTLGKLGMRADFIHVGDYKSAPERLTRTEPSAANREMIESLVEDRWEMLLGMLADSRRTTRERAVAWVDRGFYDGAGALAAGLVDTLGYLDDILDGRFGEDDVTYLADYVAAAPRAPRDVPTVALVYVTGVIVPGESRFDRMQGKLAGSETVVSHLATAREDDDIDAVILRVDSPGGSALASDLIWHEVRRVQEAGLPVIVSMGGMAASGGYYVSCPADSVFAPRGTLTGSIGVYAGKMDRSGTYRKIGLRREFITRGENALMFSDASGFSDEQRRVFSEQMSAFYDRFLDKVATGRGLDREAVGAVARGRVWTGRQGLEHGLVDAEGGLRRALDSVKWSLGLTPDDKVALATFGEQPTFLEQLLMRSLQDARVGAAAGELAAAVGWSPWLAADLAPLPALAAALRENGTFARLALLDGHPVAMAPFSLRWE